jgi:hypothetical protein
VGLRLPKGRARRDRRASSNTKGDDQGELHWEEVRRYYRDTSSTSGSSGRQVPALSTSAIGMM